MSPSFNPHTESSATAIQGTRKLASPPGSDVLARRLTATKQAMLDTGFDALLVAGRGLVSQWGYLEYLTGYSPIVRHGYAVILPEATAPVVVMSTRSDAYHSKQANGFDTRASGQGDVVGERDSVPETIADILCATGRARSRVGVVGLNGIMPAGDLRALEKSMPDTAFIEATGLLHELKAVKTAEEIEGVRAAGRVADAGLRAFIDHAAVGSSGWDLYGEMERAVRREGARDVLVFIGTGPYFLDWPKAEQLTEGDLVSAYVEVTGPTGHWVERAGLFTVGEVDDRKRSYAETCLRAHEMARQTLTVGRTAAEVARAIEIEIEPLGALPGIWHGHGVGIDHDIPIITAGDSTRLTENMVISIHPNLTDPEETVGASVADTYIVTSTGAEAISSIPQHIRSIGKETR